MDANKKWMSTGKIGCTFAALFAKNPEKVWWRTVVNPAKLEIPAMCGILSLQFPDGNINTVRSWALANGFYEETIAPGLIGLRYKVGGDVAWVQYFGPDSHVITRQAPIPELMLCVKLPFLQYVKVGFNGILHLAHAEVVHLTKRKADKLWETSYTNTAKRLGHSPTIVEASKVTFKHE